MKAQGIYCIRHLASGRVYVGSAVNIGRRWQVHRYELDRGTHHAKALQAAWAKHGSDAFEFTVLEAVTTKAELIMREQWWLDKLNAYFRAAGFNSCAIAGSVLGTRHSAEVKARMSADRLGKPAPWNRRKHTTEQNAAHAAIMRGKKRGPHKPESIEKMRVVKTGLKHSAQALEAMSRAWIKRREAGFSPETRAKLSRSRMGNKNALGHKMTAETRAKMAASQSARRAREAANQRPAAVERVD